jgi:catechol 2,3-dioxygenase-like lactoylglutathione lyase family enzyme
MTTKKLHLALSVADLDASIADYAARLGVPPCAVVDGAYALFRTDSLNLSLRVNAEEAGTLRHLGFEDPAAEQMSAEIDVNGITWERFSEAQQRAEILALWPHARFSSPIEPQGSAVTE